MSAHIDNPPAKGEPVVLWSGEAHIIEHGIPLCVWYYGGPTENECQKALYDPDRHTLCAPCWADDDCSDERAYETRPDAMFGPQEGTLG